MAPLVVLTRPGDKNQLLEKRLNDAALSTLILPALAICPLSDPPSELPLPGDYDLIVFVSGNAVRFYLDLFTQRHADTPWPARPLLATVGSASAAALYDTDYIDSSRVVHPTACETSQDSEALWASLRPFMPELRRVLIVRGESGRDWLGAKLESGGATVHRYAVYRREPAQWSGEQQRRLTSALTSNRPLVCLLTSSESADAFYTSMEAQGLQALWKQMRFVVIHERIARHVGIVLTPTSGKVWQPVIRICTPDNDSIFQAIVSVVSL